MRWRSDYELADFLPAYDGAERETQGFTAVSPENLQAVVFDQPGTLRVFRVLIGFTTQELPHHRARRRGARGARPQQFLLQDPGRCSGCGTRSSSFPFRDLGAASARGRTIRSSSAAAHPSCRRSPKTFG